MCIMETIVIAQSISDTKIRYSCPFCFVVLAAVVPVVVMGANASSWLHL